MLLVETINQDATKQLDDYKKKCDAFIEVTEYSVYQECSVCKTWLIYHRDRYCFRDVEEWVKLSRTSIDKYQKLFVFNCYYCGDLICGNCASVHDKGKYCSVDCMSKANK